MFLAAKVPQGRSIKGSAKNSYDFTDYLWIIIAVGLFYFIYFLEKYATNYLYVA